MEIINVTMQLREQILSKIKELNPKTSIKYILFNHGSEQGEVLDKNMNLIGLIEVDGIYKELKINDTSRLVQMLYSINDERHPELKEKFSVFKY